MLLKWVWKTKGEVFVFSLGMHTPRDPLGDDQDPIVCALRGTEPILPCQDMLYATSEQICFLPCAASNEKPPACR